MPRKMSSIFVLLTILLCSFAPPAFAGAQGDELDILRMYYDDRDLEVGVTRNAVPLSAVAETVTVVTADEIRAMNAHTVADVLATVPGLQQELRGGPGQINSIYIRGGDFRHIKVLLDGVSINDALTGSADLDRVPAHIVERVEIMKGPASSSWGSALGGVINILTKIPSPKDVAASVYLAGGESSFHDTNAALSGTVGAVEYFASGGHLGESGLTRRSSVDNASAYGKVRWTPTAKSSLSASLFFTGNDRSAGDGIISRVDSAQLHANVSGTYTLFEGLDVELSGRASFDDLTRTETYLIFGPDPISQKIKYNDHALGGSALVRWRSDLQSLVAGFDYDGGDYREKGSERVDLRKSGIFLADTVTVGPVSITPGARYDWTNGVISRHDFSPSLGIAWRTSEGTVLRASAAKGYSLPEIVDPKTSKIWSVQAGAETTEVPYLWLRGTFFYNSITDQWVAGKGYDDIRRIGGEIEFRTIPVFNLSLSGGVMIMNSESRTNETTIEAEPRTSWNVGLRYDDGRGLQGYLLGRQVDWNALNAAGPFTLKPDTEDFVWDLHLSKKLRLDSMVEPEIFFSLHNIFNGGQYVYQYWKNPGRWAEGGIRFSF